MKMPDEPQLVVKPEFFDGRIARAKITVDDWEAGEAVYDFGYRNWTLTNDLNEKNERRSMTGKDLETLLSMVRSNARDLYVAAAFAEAAEDAE